MNKLIQRVRDREDGVTALEYALIAALIAVVIIVSVRAAGTAASTTFSNVANELNTANH
jgi:pilus assembly protein Flp/PilA